jgi:hypothetical protein
MQALDAKDRETMNVKVVINRSDLVWMNVYLAYRAPANWSFLLFIWLGMSGMYLYRKGLSQGVQGIAEQLIYNAAISLFAVVAMLVLSVTFTVISSSKKSGVLGEHEYGIKEDGLLETTEANETLVKWTSIKSIIKTKNFALVQINWYLFHFIPSRSFSSQGEFEGFVSELNGKINASNKSN